MPEINYLDKIYFGNTVEQYITAVGVILIGLLILKFLKKILLNRLKIGAEKTQTKVDDYVVSGFERFIMPMLNISIFYIAFQRLTLTKWTVGVLQNAFMVVAIFYSIRLITTFTRILIESSIKKKNGAEKINQFKGATLLIDIVIWSLGIVFLFDNQGYDVTAILTGLGIGGLAVALAAQTILGDLFNYFVILFDKPFQIDDYIVVDDKKGHVEYIGIKTTRIKSLSGEQIIISNTNLNNSRLHNFKRLEKRRVVFQLGITYQTPYDKLKEIPTIIKKIITKQEHTELDRCHFSSYGNFSLDFETVYYIKSSDYNYYMDVQQRINLNIFKAFAEQGIEFAYPTQTVFLEKNT